MSKVWKYYNTPSDHLHSFLSTADKMNVSQRLSHDRKEVCAVSRICFLVFLSNFSLDVWTLILTTKSWRFQSVDLQKNQSCDIQNKEVNMKWPDWLTFRTENSSTGAIWILFEVHRTLSTMNDDVVWGIFQSQKNSRSCCCVDCYKCCFSCKMLCIWLMKPVSFICSKAKNRPTIRLSVFWQPYFDAHATLTPQQWNLSFPNCFILLPVSVQHLKHTIIVFLHMYILLRKKNWHHYGTTPPQHCHLLASSHTHTHTHTHTHIHIYIWNWKSPSALMRSLVVDWAQNTN